MQDGVLKMIVLSRVQLDFSIPKFRNVFNCKSTDFKKFLQGCGDVGN